MNLLGTVFKELTHIVAQLSASYDAVIAEHHALVAQQCFIRNELHLSHKVAASLVTRCKGAWPCWCVFKYCSLIRNFCSIGIAKRHAYT